MVAELWEKMSVNKQLTQNVDRERYNFRQLHEQNVKKRYQVEIRNRFVTLENVNDSEDINRAWESINTLRTGDADLRFYITTVRDG